VDKACDRFEAAWKAGEEPLIEEYLGDQFAAAEPSRQATLLHELILIDLEYRWRRPKRQSSESPTRSEKLAIEDPSRPQSLPQRPLLEDYAARFSLLGPLALFPIEVIKQEYRVRCLYGDRPSLAEYERRFSGRADVESWRRAHDGDAVADTHALPKQLADIAKLGPPYVDQAELQPAVECLLPRIGNYQLIGEIARGGMGVVYKAVQLSPRRVVALKMIRSGVLADDNEIHRFYFEAEAVAQLDHPAIVPVYEAGQHNGEHYFTMAYINGRSLSQRMQEGNVAPREAAQLMIQVAEAVQYAHKRGIIHRDLKPHNILVTDDGQPKVTDFGLAKRPGMNASLTATGQPIGTPNYMPPEQATGLSDEITPASDVYALGATLYFLLTGLPPFRGASVAETLRQVVTEEPVSPRRLNPAVDRDLASITLKCLEKSARSRYATANDFAQDLQRWLRNEPTIARPVSVATRTWKWLRRNRLVAAFTGILILISVVFVAVPTAMVMNFLYGMIGVTLYANIPLLILLVVLTIKKDFAAKRAKRQAVAILDSVERTSLRLLAAAEQHPDLLAVLAKEYESLFEQPMYSSDSSVSVLQKAREASERLRLVAAIDGNNFSKSRAR
jgi:predicted Ser/Thr protein kinase